MGIIPDYAKSVTGIYQELGIKFLGVTRSIRLLSSVAHNGTINDDLPSWIPRWDQGRGLGQSLGLDPPKWYNASRDTEKTVFVQEGRHLKLRGLITDTIQGVSSEFQGAQFLFHHVSGSGEAFGPGNPIEELLEAVGPYLSRLASPYPDIILALALTLTDGMMGPEPGDSNLVQFQANFSAYRIAKAKQLNTVWTGGDQAALKKLEEKATNGDANQYATDSYKSCNGRKFFFTKNGYVGLGRNSIKAGDLCCILYSAVVPFILRPKGEKGQYQLVGEAYCHGLMSGEAMDMLERGILKEEEIILS
jgi:hypothetical protein